MKKVMLSFAVIFAALFGVFYFWSQGPSIKNISSTRQDVLGADTVRQTKIIANDYFTIQIPERYELKTNNSQRVPVFLQQLYSVPVRSAAQLSSDQIAMTVGDLQGRPLNELSAVQLRRRSPVYTEKDLGIGTGVLSFESFEREYEISAFVENNGVYVAYVQTVSTQNKTSALAELKQSVQSLSWR